MAKRRRAGPRSLDPKEWARIEALVPRRREVSTAAAKAKGLADPNRLALALFIREARSICISDLAELTGIERSVVSRHLRRLRAAGLSECERRGRQSLHSLTAEGHRVLAVLMGA